MDLQARYRAKKWSRSRIDRTCISIQHNLVNNPYLDNDKRYKFQISNILCLPWNLSKTQDTPDAAPRRRSVTFRDFAKGTSFIWRGLSRRNRSARYTNTGWYQAHGKVQRRPLNRSAVLDLKNWTNKGAEPLSGLLIPRPESSVNWGYTLNAC